MSLFDYLSQEFARYEKDKKELLYRVIAGGSQFLARPIRLEETFMVAMIDSPQNMEIVMYSSIQRLKDVSSSTAHWEKFHEKSR